MSTKIANENIQNNDECVKKPNKFKKLNLKIKNFIMIFFAGIVNSIGVTLFLYPVKLYDSGISGLSMLLDQVTPDFLNLSIFLLVLNVPIFLFGLKKKGFTFTIYSIFAIIVYSLSSFVITNILPIDVSAASPLAESDLLLCAIFGGVLSGFGSGFVIRNGGAIDGLDVLSVIFAKKLNISMGAFVLIFNYILYTVCGFLLNSWILPLYSMVTYFVGSRTVDYVVEGFDRHKCAMVFTEKPNEIIEIIHSEFNSSCTLVDAKGSYTSGDKKIIYFILGRFQVAKFKSLVSEADPHALVTLTEVADILDHTTHKVLKHNKELKESKETESK